MPKTYKSIIWLINIFKCVALEVILYVIFISVFAFIHEYVSLYIFKIIGSHYSYKIIGIVVGFVMAGVCIDSSGRFHTQERTFIIERSESDENITIINNLHKWYNMFLFPKYFGLLENKANAKYGTIFIVLWCLVTTLIPITFVFFGVLFNLWEMKIIPLDLGPGLGLGLGVIAGFSAMEAVRWEATIRGDFRLPQPK